MLTQQAIIDFCEQYDYDIRKSGNGRWIDQKCAPDVVTVVADCICNYVYQNGYVSFSSSNIWYSDYSIENVQAIFKKPDVENETARNEYDKFFQQPMELLANANVLKKNKRGNLNFYQVKNLEILEYIALRERNALLFLAIYIEKVLRDSGIYNKFEDFFILQSRNAYKDLKKAFSDFIIDNTKINGITECNRIFIKVLNPLAFLKSLYGTERGRLSRQVITYDMLMYNRNNFRDIYADKPKGMTRKEYAEAHPVLVNEAYYHYQSAKAKRLLRDYNERNRDGKSEFPERNHLHDKAKHIHHIFPQAVYPEICYYVENLIALTPTQHLNYAHPEGNTQEIDDQYQHLLLLSKADRIYENLTDSEEEKIYEFGNFLYVLNVGFDDDDLLEIADMDFCSVVNAINIHYAA